MSRNIVDTHVHIWDLTRAKYAWLEGDKSILNQSYQLEQLLPSMAEAGVIKGVLVQAANTLEDTHLMFEAARAHSEIAGVVAWLPLENPEQTQHILQNEFLMEPYFKGVRHLIHNEPTADWLLQPNVLESLQVLADANIPYDVVGINTQHLETVARVVEKVPNLRLVLDHLNQPPMSRKERFGRWGVLMAELAQHENVYAKISGLGTASGNLAAWGVNDIEPYVAYAVEAFGTRRCFCGGDWPVSLLAGSYAQVWDTYVEVLSGLLSAEDCTRVLHSNAIDFYAL
ncbi:amidohydrolase family protein [Pedobacter sp. MW01-1-1]|uniref:amidohydrolase family protein n=1 Tax=Pedobacter sp. MW01-1-1 TaxID=3383027 RepID=UPI003FEE5FD8